MAEQIALKHLRRWRTIGWCMVAVVAVASLLPGGTPGLGLINDKVEHATSYAALTLWFCGIVPRARYWIIVISFIVMGIVIELLQGWMALGRECDIHDVYANGTGVTIGWLLSRLWLGKWAERAEAWLGAQ